ncbi:jg13161 [Pararge aegeria aegeria]|uniref:Jg13161 protein n=1 Tax=Pararge aegeria aegeria TaxID=348720 RepID=A0A8S4RV62_9NEOP|nr:jg13161 [Pararge aegeria aegeria]
MTRKEVYINPPNLLTCVPITLDSKVISISGADGGSRARSLSPPAAPCARRKCARLTEARSPNPPYFPEKIQI